jgi:hypothetical protein
VTEFEDLGDAAHGPLRQRETLLPVDRPSTSRHARTAKGWGATHPGEKSVALLVLAREMVEDTLAQMWAAR